MLPLLLCRHAMPGKVILTSLHKPLNIFRTFDKCPDKNAELTQKPETVVCKSCLFHFIFFSMDCLKNNFCLRKWKRATLFVVLCCWSRNHVSSNKCLVWSFCSWSHFSMGKMRKIVTCCLKLCVSYAMPTSNSKIEGRQVYETYTLFFAYYNNITHSPRGYFVCKNNKSVTNWCNTLTYTFYNLKMYYSYVCCSVVAVFGVIVRTNKTLENNKLIMSSDY